MAVNDIITSARYNNAQGRVAAVLGNGSGNEGYGQAVTSQQVSSGLKVTAQDINNLFTDLNKIKIHQIGAVPNSIATVAIGDTIAEDTSDGDGLKGFADYEDFITVIEAPAERFKLAVAQSSDDNAAKIAERRNQWRAPIDTEITMTFNNADHRRHFFNAGGSLTMISALSNTPVSGDSVAKSQDWANILATAGTVSINYDTTSTTGQGTPSAIGNYDLTTSYQEIYRRSATGVYGNNNYIIEAKAPNAKTIAIRFYYYDHNPGGYKIDEPVQGVLKAQVGYVRASGLYVDVALPAFAITNAL